MHSCVWLYYDTAWLVDKSNIKETNVDYSII